MTTRVFLSDANAILAIGRGEDRDSAVRSALNELQRVAGTQWDLSEFRTFDVFPAWEANPLAFFAHENDDSDIVDDVLVDALAEHPNSRAFVVLIDSDLRKHPRAA